MPRYNVLSTLNHDGKPYEAGDVVVMTEVQAAILQPVGVVGEMAAEVENTDEELVQKINAAQSAEEVYGLAGKIKRKAIVEAAAARKAELSEG